MVDLIRRFSRGAFAHGMTRGLDLLGLWNEPMPYQAHDDPAEVDPATMMRDWDAVGDDIFFTVKRARQDPRMKELLA